MPVARGNESVSTSNIIFAETKEDIRISDRIKKLNIIYYILHGVSHMVDML